MEPGDEVLVVRRIDRDRRLRLADEPTRNVLIADLDVRAEARAGRGSRLQLRLAEHVLRNPTRKRLRAFIAQARTAGLDISSIAEPSDELRFNQQLGDL